MTGQPNGRAPQVVQINPIECAQVALAFLERVSFTRAERANFDRVETFLVGIAQGEVICRPAAPPPDPPAPEATPTSAS